MEIFLVWGCDVDSVGSEVWRYVVFGCDADNATGGVCRCVSFGKRIVIV